MDAREEGALPEVKLGAKGWGMVEWRHRPGKNEPMDTNGPWLALAVWKLFVLFFLKKRIMSQRRGIVTCFV